VYNADSTQIVTTAGNWTQCVEASSPQSGFCDITAIETSFTSNFTSSSFTNNYGVGTVRWNVQTCDNSNVCAFAPSNYTFTNSLFDNVQIWNNVTLEGSTESFSLNLTYDSSVYTSISGTLIYDGTSYSSTYSGSGNNILFNKTITIPTVSSQQNKTFYWTLQLYDGSTTSYINTTRHNQTVQNIGIDDCSVFTTKIYNLTLRDEDTQVMLHPTGQNTSIEVTLNISSLGTTNSVIAFSQNYTKINPVSVCIDQSIANISGFRADGVISYVADDYVKEYYYVQNITLSNATIPQNIQLYDLLTTRSQSFLISYKDGNFIPQQDVLIDIARWYINEGVFKTVELPKTDIDGKTVGHFVTEDVVYTIYVRKYGQLLATFQNVRVVCANSVIGDCKLDLKEASSTTIPDDFTDYRNLTYIFTYNDTSKLVKFEWTSLDSLTKSIVMNVSRYDNYGNQSICSASLSTTSGSVQCTIPVAYYNSTAMAKIYSNGELVTTQIFDVSPSRTATLGSVRYILAFLLIITIPIMAISSGPMTILMFIVALIIAGALALYDYGGFVGVTSVTLWFIVSALVLLWKATRRKEVG